MTGAGLCCARLEEPKALMKMGLSMVCVGHVNFLLGALVHGVVLRHVSLNQQMEVVVSNVLALVTGLVGIVVGVLAIILSKNTESRGLTWSLSTASLAAAVTAAASTVGLLASLGMSVIQSGRSLLASCDASDAAGHSSCPFDPTPINRTALILWVPLVGTCVVQMVFSSRCFAVCLSFLGLPCCPDRSRRKSYGRAINVVRPLGVVTSTIEPSRSRAEPLTRSAKRDQDPQRWNSAPSSQLCQHPPRQHQSPPPSERQPLRQPHRERSGRQRPETRHHLLERSSLWI